MAACGTYVVVVGVTIGVAGVAPVVGATFGLLTVLWAWAIRMPRHVGVLGLAPLALAVGVPWPIPALLAVLVARAVARRPGERMAPSRIGPPLRIVGEVGAVTLLCVPLAAALACLSLGNEHQVLSLKQPPFVLIGTGVVLAALVNASAEELYWRGCMMRLLAASRYRPHTVVMVPAVSFGAAHLTGVPNGLTGVAGAFGLGLVLGVLRLRPAGLPGCVAAHAAIDMAIFGLVAGHVVWVG